MLVLFCFAFTFMLLNKFIYFNGIREIRVSGAFEFDDIAVERNEDSGVRVPFDDFVVTIILSIWDMSIFRL